MDVPEAIRQAQAHLQNAMELAPRPVGKEELLYMWDNQITAVDNFLADTEVLQDKVLATWRGKLRDAKKKLTDSVVAFEAKQAGEEPPDDDPTDEEQVESFVEIAPEMMALVAQAMQEEVKELADLVRWEEPLALVNGFLADSEPYQASSRDLQKARSQVRMARRALKGQIDAAVRELRGKDEDDA